MFPLSKPQVGVFFGHPAGHGNFIDVGDTIQPNGFCTQQFTEKKEQKIQGPLQLKPLHRVAQTGYFLA
jgi:hypothetical protein